MNKLRLFLILIASLLIIMSACGNKEQTLEKPNEEAPASLAKNYKMIDELIADAVEILHKAGDKIRIIETGGEFTPANKGGSSLPKQTMKFNGIPVLDKDEHAVIFLTRFVGPQVSGEIFVPVGVYQGKFVVDESGQPKPLYPCFTSC